MIERERRGLLREPSRRSGAPDDDRGDRKCEKHRGGDPRPSTAPCRRSRKPRNAGVEDPEPRGNERRVAADPIAPHSTRSARPDVLRAIVIFAIEVRAKRAVSEMHGVRTLF
jgi:hypothetical protein